MMALAVLLGSMLVVLAVEIVLTWRDVRRRRAAEPTKAAAPDDATTTMSYADAEAVLAARVVDGRLPAARYREAMAAIAAIEKRLSGLDPLSLIAMDGAAAAGLRRLATDLPELPRATLYAAVALAHNGATVEYLTRLLGLTHAQAVRVVAATAGRT